MADKRITDLPELIQADSGDFIPIVDSSMNVTKKVAAEKVLPNGSVTSGNFEFSTFAFGNYSAAEANTGFKWVDGSPIYKKSVAFGALPNNTNKNVPHGITGLNKVIKVEANQYEGVNRQAFPFTHGASLNFQQQILIDATDIKVYAYANRTGVTIDHITLYYTKS